MTLHAKNEPTILAISSKDVRHTLSGLKIFTKSGRWVGPRNWYSTDTRRKINCESAAGKTLLHPKQLAQYIAASPLLHCTDGWSYLGKAISAMLRGDPHRSRHLAYYAELRAAMALLATNGIGVFDKYHYVISGPNEVAAFKIKSTTHEFVWDCLEFWCSQQVSGDLFSRIVRPNAQPLTSWLAPIGGTIAVAAQARQWFLQWGMDLNLPPEDRESRNVSSYRPDGIPDSWHLDASATLDFAHALWTALEPSSSSSFDNIDRHILRLALESYFEGQVGVPASEDPQRFDTFLASVVDQQGFEPQVQAGWIDFLRRRRAPADLEILTLSKASPAIRANSHAAIISRAALLLRMASGATADLFSATGYTSAGTEFWRRELGRSRGLWEISAPPENLTDLWSDIDALLNDMRDFQRRHPPENQTFFRLGNELGQAIVGLASCERVAVWSMTPA